MRVVWTHHARDDLKSLQDYIGSENPAAAKAVALEIVAAAKRLAFFPAQGHPGRVVRTRELLVRSAPYLVVYTVHDEAIHVVRILHTSRKWPPPPSRKKR